VLHILKATRDGSGVCLVHAQLLCVFMDAIPVSIKCW